MADDDLDLSQFEEFSPTARRAGGTSSSSRSSASPASAGEGAGRGGAGRRKRLWPWLLAGVVLGVAGALLLPPLLAPYLPPFLQRDREEIRGPVFGKRIDGERLLLTLDTERGAILATFGRRVAEIDLLVEVGDTVTLGIDRYAPFVEDPVVAAVTKVRSEGGEGGPAPGVAPGTDAPADPGGDSGVPPGETSDEPSGADPSPTPTDPDAASPATPPAPGGAGDPTDDSSGDPTDGSSGDSSSDLSNRP